MFIEMNLGKEGELTIVDDDILSDYNLNRMCLTSQSEIGKGKAQILAQKCNQVNRNIRPKIIEERIARMNSKNKAKIF